MDPEKNSPEEARSEGVECTGAGVAACPGGLGSKLHTSG